MAWGYCTCNQNCLHRNQNALARHVMDSNLCAKFHLYMFPGFFLDTLVWTEQQQQEFWKLTFLTITDYAISPISWVHAFLTIQIRLICQKWDSIETESDTYNLKCLGIMLDNLCYPYLLMSTVFSLCKAEVNLSTTCTHAHQSNNK